MNTRPTEDTAGVESDLIDLGRWSMGDLLSPTSRNNEAVRRALRHTVEHVGDRTTSNSSNS